MIVEVLLLAAMAVMAAGAIWVESGGLARHGWDSKGRGES